MLWLSSYLTLPKDRQSSDESIISYYEMTTLKPGDRVDCRVKASTIVSPYRSYDEIKTFEIVAVDTHGCYLYVPHYYLLKGTTVADKYKCKNLGIDLKFLDENIIHIQENMIAGVQARLDGLSCVICKEFFPYAAPNRGDGALVCFSCRQNPYR
jgi:hypothetical protein